MPLEPMAVINNEQPLQDDDIAVATVTMTTPVKKAWGAQCVTPDNTPTSFQDIQSEDLVKHLTESPLQSAFPVEDDILQAIEKMEQLSHKDTNEQPIIPNEEDSDFLLAKMLQKQFDREHNHQVANEERHYNKQSKVKLSFENFRSNNILLDSDSDDDDDDDDLYGYDSSDNTLLRDNKPSFHFNKSGVSGKGENMISKHDKHLAGRLNSGRVLDHFSPSVETGDSSDVSMPNRVYNQLKQHSRSEAKRSRRLHEKKEHSTAENAMDEKTRLIIYKLINAGLLDSVDGIISTGKEAAVLSAIGGCEHMKAKDGFDLGPVPSHCVVKVFKTTLTDFKNRGEYIKGDVRFFKDEFKKQNPRKILQIWANKEAINLNRLRKFGVPCPSVVVCKKHVLVMSMITTHNETEGQDPQPAKKLKECQLNSEQLGLAYKQCIQYMKTMYSECKLIHADFSAYNLLWDGTSKLYVIDVGQSVDLSHPGAMSFLLRDCTNIIKYFSTAGIADTPTSYELFNDVTGLNLEGEGESFLSQLEKYQKNEIKLREHPNEQDYPFNYFYDKSCAQHIESKSTKETAINIDEI